MMVPDTDLPHLLLPSAPREGLPIRSKAAILPFARTVKPDTKSWRRPEERRLPFGFDLEAANSVTFGLKG